VACDVRHVTRDKSHVTRYITRHMSYVTLSCSGLSLRDGATSDSARHMRRLLYLPPNLNTKIPEYNPFPDHPPRTDGISMFSTKEAA